MQVSLKFTFTKNDVGANSLKITLAHIPKIGRQACLLSGDEPNQPELSGNVCLKHSEFQ